MEIIKNSMLPDEKVLWEFYEVKHYYRKTIILFLCLIMMLLGVGLFFWYVPEWKGTFYLFYTGIEVHPIVIYLMIISIFYPFIIGGIIYFIILVKRMLRLFKIKLIDLNRYKKCFILTNKRLIQKDLYLDSNFFDITKPSAIKNYPNVIERKNDIVFMFLEPVIRFSIEKCPIHHKVLFFYDLPNSSYYFAIKNKGSNIQEFIDHINKLIK